MRTWLHLLWVIFWMLPLQRWCTVLGIGVMAGLGSVLLGGSWGGSEVVLWGGLIGFLLPALLGGALWRALSAPRQVEVTPRGRAQLLLAAVGVAIAITLLWLLYHHVYQAGMELLFRTTPAGYWRQFVLLFASSTWWGIASFIASRSPLAMLAVVVFSISSFFLMDKLGLRTPAFQLNQPWGIAYPLALWTAFGIWYLRARRIAPPGWLLPGGQSVLAAVTSADAGVVALPRRAALERLLLGGASVSRLLFQWLLVFGLLLLLLLLMAQQDDNDALVVAHVVFGALIFCPAIVAVQSMAIVQRARALWLPSGHSRAELFAFTERTLLKFALGMTLVFASFLLVLWYTQPWRPSLTMTEALLVLLLPSLQLATHALTRPRRWDYYWRWPIVLLLCWFIAWKPLTSTDPVSWFGPRGWIWFVLAVVATISFHTMARRRWLNEDLPRAAVSR